MKPLDQVAVDYPKAIFVLFSDGGVYMESLTCSVEQAEILNIRDIIAGNQLSVRFQPIVSVSRKMVSGLEGLIRGINTDTKEIISPPALFQAARDADVALELDRACRENVVEAFRPIFEQNNSMLLFVNMDASILENSVGSNYLLKQVMRHGINPGNVVIEISEIKVVGSLALKKFADAYRNYGFKIALDDVGTGSSNMDRILLVKPDIIKVDMSLVRNISTDYYKQGVFKSLVNLSNKIGALVIAEGVETEEEAIEVLRLGSHMIQGYYFSIPLEFYDEGNILSGNKINSLSKRFNEYMHRQIIEERDKNKKLNRIVDGAVKQLTGIPSHFFDEQLSGLLQSNELAECAYVLDEKGFQISDTVCFYEKEVENLIFFSACRGTDHSMEKYYYPLISAKLRKFVTEPYISLATGNLCITISKSFVNCENQRFILCVDFKTTNTAYTIHLRNSMVNFNDNPSSEINDIISKMSEEIVRDGLTGAYNRRFIEERLIIDVFNSSSEKQSISIVLADLDFFKEVNDTHGHLAGDLVLKEFVKIANRYIRKNTDWVARYGGDEFLIVLNNSDEVVAERVAENIRRDLEKTKIKYKDASINVTASFGAYTVHAESLTSDQLIGQADRNLYMAKNSGRNMTFR